MLCELWKWHPTQTPKGVSIILTQKNFCSQHMALKLVSGETGLVRCIEIFKHFPLQRSLVGIFREYRGKWMVNWHLLFLPKFKLLICFSVSHSWSNINVSFKLHYRKKHSFSFPVSNLSHLAELSKGQAMIMFSSKLTVKCIAHNVKLPSPPEVVLPHHQFSLTWLLLRQEYLAAAWHLDWRPAILWHLLQHPGKQSKKPAVHRTLPIFPPLKAGLSAVSSH